MPAAPAAPAALAQAGDDVVRAQSRALRRRAGLPGVRRGPRQRLSAPAAAAKPDSLFAQLGWLEAAGFEHVDALSQRGAHALFGGCRWR